MREIKLTQNKYALVDDEDYEYLNKFTWSCSKNKNTYYAVREKLKKRIWIHRTIMSCPDGKFIDHINRNGLDNRKENLRVCTQSQNSHNSRIRKDNKSGIKGVYWHKINKKWIARIGVNSKLKHLGVFSDKLEAKNAYNTAAKNYFAELYSGVI